MLCLLPRDIWSLVALDLDFQSFLYFRELVPISFAFYFKCHGPMRFFEGVMFNSIPLLQYLQDATVEKRHLIGALEEATLYNYLDIVKYIGSQLTNRTHCNRALYYASSFGYLDIVKYLCNIDSKFSIDTAVFLAVEENQFEIVRWFYSQGTRANLEIAARRASLAMFRLLESLGDDITQSAVDSACNNIHGNTEILVYLYSLGYAASPQAILSVCHTGKLDIVQFLYFQHKSTFDYLYQVRFGDLHPNVGQFIIHNRNIR